MALPELISQAVETRLKAYYERRVPPHAKKQVRMDVAVHGNNVTLTVSRAVFGNPKKWIRSPIAQLRYDHNPGEWSLYCSDQNGHWHPYRHAEPAKDVGALFGAMDTDETGVFWG